MSSVSSTSMNYSGKRKRTDDIRSVLEELKETGEKINKIMQKEYHDML